MATKLILLSFLCSLCLLSLSSGFSLSSNKQDAENECKEYCTREPHSIHCVKICMEEHQNHHKEQHGGQGEGEEKTPYLFRSDKFHSHMTSKEGSIRVLERFGRESELLKGIDNYRLTLVEANPNTFKLPGHWDADCVWFVVEGSGAVTLLHQDNKETHKLEQGDVIRIPAGTTVHLVNSDNKEKLFIAELTVPVNTPGHFESFNIAGSREAESYLSAFSEEIMEAAFNVKGDQWRKMFQGGNEGGFVKASQEQIQALTKEESQHGASPFHEGGEESSRTYKLLEKKPTQSNKYGEMFEVSPDECKQLEDLDVGLTFVNMSQGSMVGPFYNSRSTKIALVTKGNADIEMACPSQSQSQSQQGQRGEHGSVSYQKVKAQLSCGDVFVFPAGHPVVVVSTGDENLEVVCFQIDARNNHRYPLAGKNNIMKQLESEAKELSFNLKAEQVDEMFKKQEEVFFFPGPKKGEQHEGYASV